MTDITPIFSELLNKHDARLAERAQTTQNLESYLQEAYRINKHILLLHNKLRDVRQAYLATAQPPHRTRHSGSGNRQKIRSMNDREREEIDAAAKRSIRELTASIRALEEAEQLRRDTELALMRKKYSGNLGSLGAWATGGLGAGLGKTAEHLEAEAKARDVAMHRDGVLLFLRQHLEECCRTQQEMMEKRITREMEKNRSNLAKTGGLHLHDAFSLDAYPTQTIRKLDPGAQPVQDDLSAFAASQGLTEEQVQMFEKGNQDMIRRMESEMDKIRAAQRSLVEIAELQSTLVTNLSVQREQIDLLMTDQENAEANVKGGNEQLKKAAKRPSAAKYTFFATTGLCAFLILWDLII